MLSITATDLPRFMACNGSRLMEGFTPSIGADNTLRDEGDAAHWLIQQIYNTVPSSESRFIDQKAPNGIFITEEMFHNVMPYLQNIGRMGTIEIDTSFADPDGRWEIRGRADHINFSTVTDILHVDDFKYGWGIIEPERNWTLIAHALGYILKPRPYPISSPKEIHFTIYQPRPYHSEGQIRIWKITFQHLQSLYAELYTALTNPSDELRTSTQCKNCPALVNCPAARKAQMNAIDAAEMAFNDELDNTALAYLLDHINRASDVLEQALKAYKEMAAHRLRAGQIIKNYTLENELSNRTWKEFVTPEIAQGLTGIDLTKKTLITPKQAETLGVSVEVVASLCERRNKGAKLVRMDENAKAKKLFNKPKGE